MPMARARGLRWMPSVPPSTNSMSASVSKGTSAMSPADSGGAAEASDVGVDATAQPGRLVLVDVPRRGEGVLGGEARRGRFAAEPLRGPDVGGAVRRLG
jgi:hypothetical protein